MKRFIYDRDMTQVAQVLRKNATPEENQLWYQFLRVYPVQFRRQKPVGRYVLDFYCSKARLAIELDGSQHFSEEGIAADQSRTEYLNSLGIQALRFTNREVKQYFDAVCRMIDDTVKRRLQG